MDVSGEAFSKPEKVNNIVEFPIFDSDHSEEEWAMAARAEDSIAPKTLAKKLVQPQEKM